MYISYDSPKRRPRRAIASRLACLHPQWEEGMGLQCAVHSASRK